MGITIPCGDRSCTKRIHHYIALFNPIFGQPSTKIRCPIAMRPSAVSGMPFLIQQQRHHGAAVAPHQRETPASITASLPLTELTSALPL